MRIKFPNPGKLEASIDERAAIMCLIEDIESLIEQDIAPSKAIHPLQEALIELNEALKKL